MTIEIDFLNDIDWGKPNWLKEYHNRNNLEFDNDKFREKLKSRIEKLKKRVTKDYDPNEPRFPKGSEHGGEWTSNKSNGEHIQKLVNWVEKSDPNNFPYEPKFVSKVTDLIHGREGHGAGYILPDGRIIDIGTNIHEIAAEKAKTHLALVLKDGVVRVNISGTQLNFETSSVAPTEKQISALTESTKNNQFLRAYFQHPNERRPFLKINDPTPQKIKELIGIYFPDTVSKKDLSENSWSNISIPNIKLPAFPTTIDELWDLIKFLDGLDSYNPAEPRAPKGSKEGGRWTSGLYNINVNGSLENGVVQLPKYKKLELNVANKPGMYSTSSSLSNKIKNEGGFTYQPITKDSPQPGSNSFAVSYSKKTEKVIDLDGFSPLDILDYITEHSDDLSKHDHYLGAWIDNDKVYLDCSIVVNDEKQAIKIAQDNDQLAYFSFKDMQSINTPSKSKINITHDDIQFLKTIIFDDYNPNEPREPKGQETGGEWTKSASSSTPYSVKVKSPWNVDPNTVKLVNLIRNGGKPEDFYNNSSLKKAQNDLFSIQPTTDKPGYGSQEWQDNREFIFNNKKVKGYNQALPLLVDKANSYSGGGVVRNNQAVILIGPPASGKSTSGERLAKAYGAAIVDPDDVAPHLPEYNNGIGGNALHEEASDIAAMVFLNRLKNSCNLVIPKVGHDEKNVRNLIELLKINKYNIHLVDVDVPYEEVLRRMSKRFIETGRIIPLDYLKKVGNKPKQVYDSILKSGDVKSYAQINKDGEISGNGEVSSLLKYSTPKRAQSV